MFKIVIKHVSHPIRVRGVHYSAFIQLIYSSFVLYTLLVIMPVFRSILFYLNKLPDLPKFIIQCIIPFVTFCLTPYTALAVHRSN